jgi:hypothetical protein
MGRCGRSLYIYITSIPFSESYAFSFSNHQRTCQKRRSRLSSALSKAKETWTTRKRLRLSASDAVATLMPLTQLPTDDEPPSHEVRDIYVVIAHCALLIAYCPARPPRCHELSMMERRPWSKRTGRRLPKRYRDLLPETVPLAPQAPPTSSQPAPSPSSTE